MKLKNSNYDKNSKTPIVKKNSTNQIVTQLKNLNCDKTQIVKKLKNSKCDKTQLLTKLFANCDKT